MRRAASIPAAGKIQALCSTSLSEIPAFSVVRVADGEGESGLRVFSAAKLPKGHLASVLRALRVCVKVDLNRFAVFIVGLHAGELCDGG